MGGKRKNDEDEQNEKFRRKARAGLQRKWTSEEVTAILEYLKGTILKNEELEKPTANTYYEKLSLNLNLKDVTPVKVRSKVNNLKSTYINAITWRGRTGQGIAEELGETGLNAELLKICPFFPQLDEIYGTKTSVHPPFVHDSGINSLQDESMDFALGLVETVDVAEPETLNSSATATPDSRASEVNAMKLKLQSGNSKSRQQKKDGLTLLSESQANRTNLLLQKFDADEKRADKRLETESKWKEKEFELQEKKIEMERELKLHELEKEERVARFKIEQEVKLQIELAKLKYETRN